MIGLNDIAHAGLDERLSFVSDRWLSSCKDTDRYRAHSPISVDVGDRDCDRDPQYDKGKIGQKSVAHGRVR